MMPPLPITLAFVALIGYPLIQIAAIRYRRSWRLRFNALAEEMAADRRLTYSDRHLVKRYMTASRGEPATWWRYARTPWRVFLAEISGNTLSEPPAKTERDKKFKELSSLALQLEWATYPIGFGVMMLFGVPLMLLGWTIGQFRGAEKRPHLSMTEIRRAALFEMSSVAKAA